MHDWSPAVRGLVRTLLRTDCRLMAYAALRPKDGAAAQLRDNLIPGVRRQLYGGLHAIQWARQECRAVFDAADCDREFKFQHVAAVVECMMAFLESDLRMNTIAAVLMQGKDFSDDPQQIAPLFGEVIPTMRDRHQAATEMLQRCLADGRTPNYSDIQRKTGVSRGKLASIDKGLRADT